jgi:crotonobetainyl-CoA:carnitine CoA-transferase CaiB-like acyl-CoA transferase
MTTAAAPSPPGFLSPYRVLDLTDYRGVLAGHMLAQLGAEVIQVEPPGGTDARRQPPYAPDWPQGENSLYWAAYGSGKRSVVCDPSTPAGLADFHRLVACADFLFESAAPSQGRPAWLDPQALAAVNPRLIHVTISPFGLTGPKSGWADSEITLWAAGGPLLLTRGLDERPLRISAPQAYHHAASDAAGAALIAHFARLASGRGQHIDVSVQASVPQATLSAVLAAAVHHPDFVPRPPPPGTAPDAKGLDLSGSGSRTRRSKWPVSDGIAEMHLGLGPAAGVSTNQLFAWMRREGALDEAFWDWDWTTLPQRIEAGEVSEAQFEAARDNVSRFMLTRRRDELMQIAIELGIRIAPVESVADLLTSPHEAARGFFRTVHGPFGDYRLPGDFAMGAGEGFVDLGPAPRLGEHTQAVMTQLSAPQEAQR